MNEFYTSVDVKECRLNSERNKIMPQTNVVSCDKNQECVATVRLKIEDIKKPSENSPSIIPKKIDVSTDDDHYKRHIEFSFEKKRLEIIGQAKALEFFEEGPSAEVDARDPQIVSLAKEKKSFLENETAEAQLWGTSLKILTVLEACITILSAIISMLYIFLMAVYFEADVIKETIPIGFTNLIASAWIVFLSIKGSAVSNCKISTDPILFTYMKLLVVSIIVFVVQLVLMSNLESIPGLADDISNGGNNATQDARANGFVGLGYLFTWSICILNLATTGLALTFTILLRRHLHFKGLLELKQKVLPLGYQLFPELKEKQNKPIASPYEV